MLHASESSPCARKSSSGEPWILHQPHMGISHVGLLTRDPSCRSARAPPPITSALKRRQRDCEPGMLWLPLVRPVLLVHSDVVGFQNSDALWCPGSRPLARLRGIFTAPHQSISSASAASLRRRCRISTRRRRFVSADWHAIARPHSKKTCASTLLPTPMPHPRQNRTHDESAKSGGVQPSRSSLPSFVSPVCSRWGNGRPLLSILGQAILPQGARYCFPVD